MAPRAPALLEDLREPAQRLLGVDGARRVVRRVDEHGSHARVQRALKRVEIDLEMRGVRGHHRQCGARARHIRLVFGEVRGERDDLAARLGHRAERVRERRGRAGGGEDVRGRVVHAEAAVERIGDRAAHRLDADGRAVAVQRVRRLRLVEVDHRARELRRAWHARIAEREVEHLACADLRAAGARAFADHADHGFAVEHVLVCFVDHGSPVRPGAVAPLPLP